MPSFDFLSRMVSAKFLRIRFKDFRIDSVA
jgi:hypothetical protein